MAAGDIYRVDYDVSGEPLMDSLCRDYHFNSVVCVGEFATPTGSGGNVFIQDLVVGDKVHLNGDRSSPMRPVLSIAVNP